MKYIYSLISILTLSFSWGQFEFNYLDSITVIDGPSELAMPWAGGLNYAQFSDIDYDFDGDMDLLVFDRSNNQLRIFEHIQTAGISSYRYDPFGEQWFPSDMGIACLQLITTETIKKICLPMV